MDRFSLAGKVAIVTGSTRGIGRAIAEAFVAKMGFDDHEGTKAPTRWVAARHGLSAGGNDHVHLVVNLVREDGIKAEASDVISHMKIELPTAQLARATAALAEMGLI